MSSNQLWLAICSTKWLELNNAMLNDVRIGITCRGDHMPMEPRVTPARVTALQGIGSALRGA